MTSMREKIARAIYETDDRVRAWAEWQDLTDDDPTRLSSLHRADAVLDALMEPTTAMEVDGALHLREHPGDANGCYQAMITSAKEGK